MKSFPFLAVCPRSLIFCLTTTHRLFLKNEAMACKSASNQSAPVIQVSNEDIQAARLCFDEQGLEAALRYLDTLPAGEPRDQFHRQYFGAQLMEEAGWYSLRNSSTGCCSGWDCR